MPTEKDIHSGHAIRKGNGLLPVGPKLRTELQQEPPEDRPQTIHFSKNKRRYTNEEFAAAIHRAAEKAASHLAAGHNYFGTLDNQVVAKEIERHVREELGL